MRSRRASHGSARPLNCGVMRLSTTVICAFTVALSATISPLCGAQGLRPIDQCPDGLKPSFHPSPNFPEYGEWQVSVTVSFVLDRDGSVLVPAIRDATWQAADKTETMPPSFEKAIVEAFTKSRFPPQPRACKGTISFGYSHRF